MNEQEQRSVFEELKDYVGSAVHVARIMSRLSSRELAQKLGKDEKFVDAIREEGKGISFEQLQLFCKALEQEVVLVLKLAKFLQEQDGRLEKEVLQDIIEESRYRLWKNEQGN